MTLNAATLCKCGDGVVAVLLDKSVVGGELER